MNTCRLTYLIGCQSVGITATATATNSIEKRHRFILIPLGLNCGILHPILDLLRWELADSSKLFSIVVGSHRLDLHLIVRDQRLSLFVIRPAISLLLTESSTYPSLCLRDVCCIGIHLDSLKIVLSVWPYKRVWTCPDAAICFLVVEIHH